MGMGEAGGFLRSPGSDLSLLDFLASSRVLMMGLSCTKPTSRITESWNQNIEF